MKSEVQSLRGLACVLLVIYHVVGADPTRGLRVSEGTLRLMCDALAVVRMPLFALLAGAMYGRRPKASWTAIDGKFRRLIVPMLTIGTIFAIVQASVPGTNVQLVDWRLLHIVPVAHYWFLESLFLVFCTVMLVEQIGILRYSAGFAVVFSMACAVYLSHPGFVWLGVAGAAYLMPFFLCGMALERYQQLTLFRMKFAAPVLLLFGLTVMVLFISPAPEQNRYTPEMLLTGLLLSAGLWLRPFRSGVLARIGFYSYAIFLYHAFFTAAARITMERFGLRDISSNLAVGLALGLLGPMLLQRIFVRSNVLRVFALGMRTKSEEAAGRVAKQPA